MSRSQQSGDSRDDEDTLNKVLEDVKMLEEGMSYEEKRKLVDLLKRSKEDHERSMEKEVHNSSQQQESRKNIPTPSSSQPSHRGNSQVGATRSSPDNPGSPSELISEDESEDENIFQKKELRVNLVRVDPSSPQVLKQEGSPGSQPGTVPLMAKGRGRGRAVPTIYKAQNSQERSPGQSPSVTQSETPNQKSRLSLRNQTPGLTLAPFTEAANNHVASQAEIKSGSQSDDIEVLDEMDDNNPRLVPLVERIDDPEESAPVEPSAPSAQQEESSGATEEPDISMTAQSKTTLDVSPLLPLIKAKQKIPSYLSSIQKYKGNGEIWIKDAMKAAEAQRLEYLESLSRNQQEWGPGFPVGVGGKVTRSRDAAPTYNSLFGDSTKSEYLSGRQDRHAKTVALNRMNQDDDWPGFPSTRQRAKQREPNDKAEEERQTQIPNAWHQRTNNDRDRSSQDHLDIGQPEEMKREDSDEIWHSLRASKKTQYVNSEPNSTSQSPNRSLDPFEYIEDNNDDDDWQAPTASRNKRNAKRGGRSNLEHDAEPQGKPSQRGRGKKTRGTSARVAKGAISRPGEHSQRPDDQKRSDAPDFSTLQDQEDMDKSNGNRGWMSKESAKSQGQNVDTNIAPNKFYKSKGQNRNNSSHNNSLHLGASTSRCGGAEEPEDNDVSITHDTSRSEELFPCPICNSNFEASKIEAHASECQEFSIHAEGDEEPELKEKRGGGASGAVEANTKSVTVRLSENSSNCKECEICHERFTSQEFEAHSRECKEKLAPHSAGHKRASSEQEEGPAKKTTRRLGINGK